MTSWQRKLRLALGVLVLIVAAAVYATMRRQVAPSLPAHVTRPTDPKARSEVNQGIIRQFSGKELKFELHYDKVLEYAGGIRTLHNVRAVFPGRNGGTFEASGTDANVAEDQSSFVMKGNVRLKSSDGLVVQSEEASYAQGEGIVRIPGPVEFSRGRMHGTAVGLDYDEKRDVISLLQRVHVMGDEGSGEAPSHIEAGSAVWVRTPGETGSQPPSAGGANMRFDGDARITRRGQTLAGDSALMYLTPDEAHLQRLELHGNALITGSPAAPVRAAGTGAKRPAPPPAAAGGTLREMRATDISLTYSEDGETLQQASCVGGASVEMNASEGTGVTRIAGEFIDIGLDQEGTGVRTLLTRAADAKAPRAQLSLPASRDAPARIIRSVTIQGPAPGMPADASGRLTSLHFDENVEYREMPAAPALPTRATSRLLDATMAPGFGTLEEAHFSGSVTFRRGDTMLATARDAVYAVKIGQLDLTGADERGDPQVIDDQATIQARHIKVTPDSHAVWAQDAVQSNFKPGQTRPDGTKVHTPGILSGDQPVYATSDHLDYDGVKSTAIFASRNRAQLWQPERGTAIHAPTIQVDNNTGNLFAKGGVVSTLVLTQPNEKTKRQEKITSEGRADQMAYDDATRRATYTTGAHIKGREGDLTADRAVMFLSEDGSALQRLEAFTKVVMVTEGTADTGTRTTRGDKLVYTASDEQYVVTGRTVNYSDACYETQGKTLKFFRSTDKIFLDGNEERRTQTKGGQGCKKEPHFD